jgi:hypothetical protein
MLSPVLDKIGFLFLEYHILVSRYVLKLIIMHVKINSTVKPPYVINMYIGKFFHD